MLQYCRIFSRLICYFPPNDNLFDDILSSAKDGKWCECIKLLPLLRTRIAIAIVFAPKD